jgi:hypothetical protein
MNALIFLALLMFGALGVCLFLLGQAILVAAYIFVIDNYQMGEAFYSSPTLFSWLKVFPIVVSSSIPDSIRVLRRNNFWDNYDGIRLKGLSRVEAFCILAGWFLSVLGLFLVLVTVLIAVVVYSIPLFFR